MALTLGQVRHSVRNNIRENESALNSLDIDDFINQGIDLFNSEQFYINVADETLNELADTYEYALTGGELGNLRYLYDIYEETETANLFHQYPMEHNKYTIEYASTPFILFDRNLFSPTAGIGLRIIGAAIQSRVDEDSDIIYIPASYIIAAATWRAHRALAAGGSPQRVQYHQNEIAQVGAELEIARLGCRHTNGLRAKRMLVPNRV